MYKILRFVLFAFDPERAHYFSMNCLQFVCRLPLGTAIIKKIFQPKKDQYNTTFNLPFKNKIGLGAGFDKNARYLTELETLGFGFVEIGTVTPKPQSGNDKPRLFRLPKDKALINRMGFNNDGVEAVAAKLQKWLIEKGELCITGDSSNPNINHSPRLIIGGNIGKNKSTPNEDAWKDYETCFTHLYPYVDYFVVNVSSPNTPGLRELQEKKALQKILTHLQELRSKIENAGETINKKMEPETQSPLSFRHSSNKPILLKIAPDLSIEQINDVIDLAIEIQLDGLVISNTTISREGLVTGNSIVQKIGPGGLSGLPVKKTSTQLVNYMHQKTNGQIPIIASGGVFTAADAREKLSAGASLVQVWTGFIYEGPGIIKHICNGL